MPRLSQSGVPRSSAAGPPRAAHQRKETLQAPTLAQAARRATTVLNKDQRRQAAQTLVALAGSVESGLGAKC